MYPRAEPEYTREDEAAELSRNARALERELASIEAAIARYPGRSGMLEIRMGEVMAELADLEAREAAL